MGKTIEISQAAMEKRIARFKEMKPSKTALYDGLLPEHAREFYVVISDGVVDDPLMKPAISDVKDFHLFMIKAEPGKGTGNHAHPTIEVHIPLSGDWTFYWGEKEANTAKLGQWDVISFPPGVLHGFRNDSKTESVMLSILGGTDPGRLIWSKSLLEKVKATGLVDVTEDGDMVMKAR